MLDDSFLDDFASKLKILFASLLSDLLKLLLTVLDVIVKSTVLLLHLLLVLLGHTFKGL